LDGLWNDDFHHALLALLTGERTGALVDHGRVENLAKAFRENFVFTGQYSQYKKRRHGRSGADLDPRSMVVFAQNHDQVGNRPLGDRLASRVSFDKQKLAAAVVLLSPFLPLLFMGEEYGETAAFPYFTGFEDQDLAASVQTGRQSELERLGFSAAAPNPQDEATFRKARLDWSLRGKNQHALLLEWYRALLRVRRDNPVFATGRQRQAVAFEDERVLFVRRSMDHEEAFVVYNFADHPVEIALPVPAGTYRLLLTSSDSRFSANSQSKAPREVVSSGQVRMSFGPSESVVYTRVR
jgi:maltooligosyltrehalose trehalohydrolase